ncbi:MAG TPA: hypothetical protein VGP94_00145 [Tepidisphaeraceae bacterium]|nr:hypothetical protein [Tepidisphaeraceae bacterium]
MHRVLLIAFWLTLTAAAAAQEQGNPVATPSTLITIYSSARFDDFDAARLVKGNQTQIPGMAIIQQRRRVDLNEGETTVHLTGIASSADFSTLSLRPASADSFKVLAQSLLEPAGDPDTLLRRAVGHEIIINRKTPPIADRARTPETINAKLLAFDQNQLVIETSNRQLPVQIIPRNADIAEIKLMAESAAPTTRPAVSARISSSKTGPQEAILSYHATGITWHADYEILLGEDQTKAPFTSSITILNRTGASFDDARVNLIASGRASEESGKAVYSLPQPVSLPADAAHRVTLVDAPSVTCQMILACRPEDFGRTPTFVSTYLAIENSSKNNLGRALPEGRVRVIRQSALDAPMLLANDVLAASAQNDLILVRVGPATPITARHEMTERFDNDKTAANPTVQITLRNPTEQPQKILLLEPLPGPASQVIEKSAEYQIQSQSLLFKIDVPANGQKVVSYTVRRPAR